MSTSTDRLSPSEAWAAGVLESGAQLAPWLGGVGLRVRKQDPATLLRLRDVTGVGEVYPPRGDKDVRSTYFVSDDEVVELLGRLAPMLSPSFRERANALLERVLGVEL